jgi:hypothetical protein
MTTKLLTFAIMLAAAASSSAQISAPTEQTFTPMAVNKHFWLDVPSEMKISKNTSDYVELEKTADSEVTIMSILNEPCPKPPTEMIAITRKKAIIKEQLSVPNTKYAFGIPHENPGQTSDLCEARQYSPRDKH